MHRSVKTSVLVIGSFALHLGCITLTLAQSDLTPGSTGMTRVTLHDVHRDVSRPLRDLAKEYVPSFKLEPIVTPENLQIPVPQVPVRRDGALQSRGLDATFIASPTLNFEGQDDGSLPPDPNGAVGINDYVQIINSEFQIYSKVDGSTVQAATPINSLWVGFGGPCENQDDGDPTIAFDKAFGVWVIQQFTDVAGPPYYDCVAVSTTADPTGSYYRYSFSFPTFPDYPKLGVWPSVFVPNAPLGAYTFTANMFSCSPRDCATPQYLGPIIGAFNRYALLFNAPTELNFFQEIPCQSCTYYPLMLPVDMDGYVYSAQPPSNEPAFFMTWDPGGTSLDIATITPCFPDCSTVQPPTAFVSVPAFTPYYAVAPQGSLCDSSGGARCDIPEASGDGTELDSLSDRSMYRLAYRNFGTHESVVFDHTVAGANNVAAVRWYEIQNPTGTPVVTQVGTFSPDLNYRWMGSTAMDQAGNQAVGYSLSCPTCSPSIVITGRTPNDPAGTLETETNVVSGSSQVGGLNRWGDYSVMQVDPVDDCTFWYTQEYINSASGTSSTRVTNFNFPGCGGSFSISASPSDITALPGQNSQPFSITSAASNGVNGTVPIQIVSITPSDPTAYPGYSFTEYTIAAASGGTTGYFIVSPTAAYGNYTVKIAGHLGQTASFATLTLSVVCAQGGFNCMRIPSNTTVTSSTKSSTAGQMVTLTASITPGGPPFPTGNVEFLSNGSEINECGVVPLSSVDVATCTTPSLSIGTDTITAQYMGDANYAASTGTLSESVAPSIQITCPSNCSTTIAAGQTGNVALTINAASSSSVSSATLACSGQPSDGSCTFSRNSITSFPGNVKLTITTTSNDASLSWPRSLLSLAFGIFVPALFILKKRHPSNCPALLLLLATVSAASLTGCGGGSTPPPPQSKAYVVTVTATDNNGFESTKTISLTVQGQ